MLLLSKRLVGYTGYSAGGPVQDAAAINDPRVQVAGQQQVELLEKQRNGQADSEEAERAAVEEEGPPRSLHRRRYRPPACCWRSRSLGR